MKNELCTIGFQSNGINYQMDIYDADGNRWVPSAQVGEALGSTRIRALVSELAEAGELKEGKHYCTLTVHRQSDGKLSPHLVLSYRGIIRVAMRSEGKRAAEFRDWAEEVLHEVLVTGQYVNPKAEPTLAGLAEQISHASMALGSPRLTSKEIWDLVSSIVSALFGVESAQMLGEKEVKSWYYGIDMHNKLHSDNQFRDRPILGFGYCKQDESYRAVLDPAILLSFGSMRCRVEPGIASPEKELYEAFCDWCETALGLEDRFSPDLFHNLLVRGWYDQHYRFRQLTIAGELWWMGIAPKEVHVPVLTQKQSIYRKKKPKELVG